MGWGAVNVAGIDYSTRAVDLVLVHMDDLHYPLWFRYPLVSRGELDDPFERTREVGEALPGRASEFWDDIVAVGVEHPGGKWTGDMLRVQGAILSCIPARMQVEPWPPAKWRKAVHLPGDATKADVWEHSLNLYEANHGDIHKDSYDWPQDAHDAHLIALATRQAIRTEKAA